jgi:hypothetical protein
MRPNIHIELKGTGKNSLREEAVGRLLENAITDARVVIKPNRK